MLTFPQRNLKTRIPFVETFLEPLKNVSCNVTKTVWIWY